MENVKTVRAAPQIIIEDTDQFTTTPILNDSRQQLASPPLTVKHKELSLHSPFMQRRNTTNLHQGFQ